MTSAHNTHYVNQIVTRRSYAPLMSSSQRLWWLKQQLIHADRTECWEWPGARSTQGYGRVGYKGGVEYAHRAAWMMEHGKPLPQDRTLVVMHECDNPPCVNPDHLRLGTQAENIQSAQDQGSWSPRGEAAPTAKLTEDAVRAIRASDESQSTLAARFGVSQVAIHKVKTRQTWRHVEEDG